MKKLLVFVVLTLCSCSLGSEKIEIYQDSTPVVTQHTFLTHTVKYSGETLGLIASWYTGSSSNWKEILSFNDSLDIYNITIGQEVLIPEYLLVKNETMTSSFMKRRSSPASSSRKVQTSSKEVEVTSDNIPEDRPELENQFQSDSREVGKIVVEDKSEVREKTPREQYLENMLRNEGR